MFCTSFEYHRPTTVAEAVALLAANPDARVLAGGHSLLPLMKLRLATPPAVVDIGRIRELAGIRRSVGLEIGALTTHAAVAAAPEVAATCPLMAEAAAQIGDTQVRNRGTIGGSLAHAHPGADLPTVMLALDAVMTAIGSGGSREIAADDFFQGLFTTALQPAEILTGIRVPLPPAGTGAAYLKHRHPASSYAVVGVAALVTLRGSQYDGVRLVVGGATPRPVRCSAAEAALQGHDTGEGTIAAAARLVGEAITDPMSDLYASAEYRRHLATVMAERALTLATQRSIGAL